MNGGVHVEPSERPKSQRTYDIPARCQIWGVVNVTPDSFSDGGRYDSKEAAFAHGRALLQAGADVLDVGGESTRPAGRTYGEGAVAVSVEDELGRVVPVVKQLVGELRARVSIDTTKAEVAAAALSAGAAIVNDVSCGTSAALLKVAAEHEAELVLMHNRRRGQVDAVNTDYADLVGEVIAELDEAVQRAVAAGVRRDRIWLDPGIGFAKSWRQSLELLRRIPEIVATGHPVLVGASRKSLIAEAAPNPDGSKPAPRSREGGTAATVVASVWGGARAVRVHDVFMMRQCARVSEAMRTEERGRA